MSQRGRTEFWNRFPDKLLLFHPWVQTKLNSWGPFWYEFREDYTTWKIFIGQSMSVFNELCLFGHEKRNNVTGSSPSFTSSSDPDCSFPLIYLFLPSPFNIPPNCERLPRGGFWEDACMASREHWNGEDEWDFPLVTWTRKNSSVIWSQHLLWAQSGRMSVDGEEASVLWCPKWKGRRQGSVNCQKCLWSKGR